MRNDIRPGGTFPDYELPDHLGIPRRLTTLQGSNPMVLILSRGAYCPKDRNQLKRLVPFYEEVLVGNSALVTITTDKALELNELRMGLGALWPFLRDEQRQIQHELDIAEYTDAEHDPMIPHTFVLAPGLKIHSVYNGYWYWGRPSLAELHRDLREVTRLRTDYDLAAPGLREAWERDERAAFFPYGESMDSALARMSGDVDRYA